jgi:hypothetical protein
MALLFIDSFDHYGTADITLKWSAASASAGTFLISTTGGRRGGGALSLKFDALTRKDLPGSTTLIVGAAIRFGDFGVTQTNYFLVVGGVAGQHIYVGTNLDGSLGVWRRAGTFLSDNVLLASTTAGVVQAAVYAYVEVKVTVSATVGKVRILVNGATVLNLVNINTLGFGSTVEQASRVTLNAPYSGASSPATLFDDLYMCDDTGSINNDFFGDVRVDMVLPNADGTYHDFTPDTGTVHFSRVNEAVADSLSNVASSTVGHKDSYHFTALTGIVGLVRGVQIVDAATKDDAGVRSISHLAKSGVSESFSTALPLSTDRKLYTTIYETDPATGTNWTQSGINAAEFGVVVAA